MRTRTRRIIQGADYSAQEPRVLSQKCGDKGMLQAYIDGKDLYVEIASIALHLPYNECLEHFPKDTPIKKQGEDWVYATDEEIANNDYDKLADGDTDTYHIGKERRNQAKKILLGIMYGRGEKSIAEQLGCNLDEAKAIKDNVYNEFPRIKEFEEESKQQVKNHRFVTTIWGRKRRLPDYTLPEVECKKLIPVKDKKIADIVINDKFKGKCYFTISKEEVPMAVAELYINNYNKQYKKDAKTDYINKCAIEDKILVIDNRSKIAAAQRQIINSQVQGSAADMSKLALIKIFNDEELKQRGVKIIIPVHDEILIETPLRYAIDVKKQFIYDMENAPKPTLAIPITCDVVSSDRWYGEELDLEEELKDVLNKE